MFIFNLIIFLIILLFFLFGAHLFFYFSAINFLSINSILYKKILFYIFLLLPVSFIVSVFFARISESFFIRAFYFLSSFWMGLLVNLLMASIIIWSFIFISHIANFNIHKTFIASVFFSLAFLISIYGVFNAFNLKTKEITAKIPGLPTSWKNKKIVQISDTHFGVIHKTGLMKKIINKVNLIRPQLIVITGDLFDGMDGDAEYFVKSISNLKTDKGIYFVIGNHETYFGIERVYRALKNTQIKILNDEVVDIDGLKLIGISYPKRNEKKYVVDVVKSLKNEYLNKPNILLYHSPSNIEQIKTTGVNLQLSGHTHYGQIFPFGFITNLIYHGHAYGLYKYGNYTLYTTSGAGTWGPAMRIGSSSEIVVINLE